jgi:phospholipid/cholesterol/gamma-HCH transport system permease protein
MPEEAAGKSLLGGWNGLTWWQMTESDSNAPHARWLDAGGGPVLEISGDWLSAGPVPQITGEPAGRPPVEYRTAALGRFDSSLPAYLLSVLRGMDATDAEADAPPLDGLPPNLHGLMELALSVPEKSETGDEPGDTSEINKLGAFSIGVWKAVLSVAEFTGQSLLSLGRFLTGRAHFRSRDFWVVVQDCGVNALPIVSLISFLIGLILAFVGNVQLASFGASLYVADLVGIAMVREMGVVMTAIIMSGRTGAAFAAHLGSMKANEEIDALKTFGFNPFDFLVLPRMLALVLMMPILTVYANIIGILGGMLVGAAVGIPPVLYWNETLTVVNLTNSSLGIFKSVFFGFAIAMSGCLQGMRAAKSSAGVGQATTRAVVASITAVIVLDSAFAAIFTVLDI